MFAIAESAPSINPHASIEILDHDCFVWKGQNLLENSWNSELSLLAHVSADCMHIFHCPQDEKVIKFSTIIDQIDVSMIIDKFWSGICKDTGTATLTAVFEWSITIWKIRLQIHKKLIEWEHLRSFPTFNAHGTLWKASFHALSGIEKSDCSPVKYLSFWNDKYVEIEEYHGAFSQLDSENTCKAISLQAPSHDKSSCGAVSHDGQFISISNGSLISLYRIGYASEKSQGLVTTEVGNFFPIEAAMDSTHERQVYLSDLRVISPCGACSFACTTCGNINISKDVVHVEDRKDFSIQNEGILDSLLSISDKSSSVLGTLKPSIQILDEHFKNDFTEKFIHDSKSTAKTTDIDTFRISSEHYLQVINKNRKGIATDILSLHSDDGSKNDAFFEKLSKKSIDFEMESSNLKEYTRSIDMCAQKLSQLQMGVLKDGKSDNSMDIFSQKAKSDYECLPDTRPRLIVMNVEMGEEKLSGNLGNKVIPPKVSFLESVPLPFSLSGSELLACSLSGQWIVTGSHMWNRLLCFERKNQLILRAALYIPKNGKPYGISFYGDTNKIMVFAGWSNSKKGEQYKAHHRKKAQKVTCKLELLIYDLSSMDKSTSEQMLPSSTGMPPQSVEIYLEKLTQKLEIIEKKLDLRLSSIEQRLNIQSDQILRIEKLLTEKSLQSDSSC